VIIVGGGMAGVACAAELARHDAVVTLIDRHNYTQFQPLLYQVTSSQLPAEDIARPLGVAFKEHRAVTIITAEVAKVDLTNHSLVTSDGEDGSEFTADYLVIAAGSQADYFGIPGAAEHSYPLYSVLDARRLRRHVRDRLRVLCDPTAEAQPYEVIICGGGPTGVETAGALAELFSALTEEGRLRAPASVTLIDHGATLLRPFSDKSHEYALRKLIEKGVRVRLGVAVSAVAADSVTLSDDSTIATDTVIWAGGISGAPLVALTGLPTGHGGRIDVAADLSVPGHAGVYAIGDVANIPDTDGRSLPQLGSVAQQSGRWAAGNILATDRGDDPKPFHYHDKGIMAMIGRNAAVAEVGAHRHQMEGPVAFAAWLGLHAVLLSGAHSEVDAFLNWADDYFHHGRAPDLELDDAVGRIAWADDEAEKPQL
jgi:NADH dehydrogenase